MMTQPPGPLAVSSANPRYFSAVEAPQQAVYLTGSHVNNNFHDGLGLGAIARKSRNGSTSTPIWSCSLSGVTTSFASGGGNSFGASWVRPTCTSA